MDGKKKKQPCTDREGSKKKKNGREIGLKPNNHCELRRQQCRAINTSPIKEATDNMQFCEGAVTNHVT